MRQRVKRRRMGRYTQVATRVVAAAVFVAPDMDFAMIACVIGGREWSHWQESSL